MAKQELMENYTFDEIADMIVTIKTVSSEHGKCSAIMSFEKSGTFENPEKTYYKSKIEMLATELGKYKQKYEKANDEIAYLTEKHKNKIDELKAEIAELHCEAQAEKVFPDEFLEEPIAVAEMLINAEGEYERNPIVKGFYGTDKGTYRLFDVSDLRQIAEHLLVYCNHNEDRDDETRTT